MRCFYVLKNWSSSKLSLNRDLSLNKMSLNEIALYSLLRFFKFPYNFCGDFRRTCNPRDDYMYFTGYVLQHGVPRTFYGGKICSALKRVKWDISGYTVLGFQNHLLNNYYKLFFQEPQRQRRPGLRRRRIQAMLQNQAKNQNQNQAQSQSQNQRRPYFEDASSMDFGDYSFTPNRRVSALGKDY